MKWFRQWLRPAFLVLVCLTLLLSILAPSAAGASSPTRQVPSSVTAGQTFQVSITFTSPANDMNAITLEDVAPDGWNVTVDKTLCTPAAYDANAIGNRAQFVWDGPYAAGVSFTAVYRVTVPGTAIPGSYAFSDGTLRYYVSSGATPTVENITGSNTVTIPGAGFTLQVQTVGSGSVTRTPNQANYSNGAVVTLTATAASGWVFAGWSGDLTGNTNPAQITMNSNKNVTATFVQGTPRTLTVNIVGQGTVVKEPNQSTYSDGVSVKLTAATNVAGWAFTGWSGDLTGDANPATIVLNGDKAVTATFSQAPAGSYTLQVTVTGQGTVVRAPVQRFYPAGTTVSLTATPAANYLFAGWGGDLSGTMNPKSIVIDSNKSASAVFSVVQVEEPPPPPPINVTINGSQPGAPCRLQPNGVSLDIIKLTSDDKKGILTIPSGTWVLGSDGKPVTNLSTGTAASVPKAPVQSAILLAANFGPEGTKFDPAAVLTVTYDPAALPAGADQKQLYLAWWNGSEWTALPSVVETGAHTVSARVAHFTQFALIARNPPACSLSDFKVSPAKLDMGGTITVQSVVSNNGGSTGQYTVTTMINDVLVGIRELTLAAGKSENIILEARLDEPGEYVVDVNGKTARVTVVSTVAAPPPATTTPPAVPTTTPAKPPITPTAAPTNPAPASTTPAAAPTALAAAPTTLAVAPTTLAVAPTTPVTPPTTAAPAPTSDSSLILWIIIGGAAIVGAVVAFLPHHRKV